MMNLQARLLIVLAALMFADTAMARDKVVDTSEQQVIQMFLELNGKCNYGIPEQFSPYPGFACFLDKLKKRCNPIDDCYFYCISRNVGKRVGGGCAHLCNYGNRQPWTIPPDAAQCR